MAGLTALDIIVLLIVGSAMALGALRGFVVEVMSLVAWVAGVIAVKLLHGSVSALLGPLVGTGSGAAVLAFAVIFGFAFLGTRALGRALGQRTRASLLGPVDRVLGLGFGALKGLLGATLLFLFASLIHQTIHGVSAERPQWMTQSRTYPLLRASSAALVDFVERRRRG